MRRQEAGIWLEIGAGFLGLSLVSMFFDVAGAFLVTWDPREMSASYWDGMLPLLWLIAVVAVLVPAAAAASAVASLFALPRRRTRVVGAALVTVVALAVLSFNWWLGPETIGEGAFGYLEDPNRRR